MTTRADFPADTADLFLVKARTYLAAGDLPQASEKGWGATAQMVKAVAVFRGWKRQSHGDLYRIVSNLATELDDQEIRNLFRSANDLHQNFYEGRMTQDFVADALNDVDEITARLRAVIS
jgi:stage V sporulation protein SpoVS